MDGLQCGSTTRANDGQQEHGTATTPRASPHHRSEPAGTPRLGIIKGSETRLTSPVSSCLLWLQVRAEDAFQSEIPPSCESSSRRWMKRSTLRVTGRRITPVTKSLTVESFNHQLTARSAPTAPAWKSGEAHIAQSLN